MAIGIESRVQKHWVLQMRTKRVEKILEMIQVSNITQNNDLIFAGAVHRNKEVIWETEGSMIGKAKKKMNPILGYINTLLEKKC